MKEFLVLWKLPNWKTWKLLEGTAKGSSPESALENYLKARGFELMDRKNFLLRPFQPLEKKGRIPVKITRKPVWPAFQTSHPNGTEPDWPAAYRRS